MKAIVCQDKKLSLVQRPDPTPGKGQVLVQVLRCGICGSDLHMRHHCAEMGQVMTRSGYQGFPQPDQEIIFGHEFCAEVIEHGPGCKKTLKPGTRVCAVPVLREGNQISMLGMSASASGAYAERMLVEEAMMVAVPNGLDADRAALTEPMAVAWHAVRRSEVKRNEVAIVIGCGPVGLAVICLLKARGVATIVASDFSAGRRALAKECGASVVVNPAEASPFSNWQQFGFIGDLSGALEMAVGTREKLGKLPMPWWHTWRLAEALGAAPKRPVVFECVGVPGLLQQIINGAPMFARVVVVGVCMQTDKLEPAQAINKEIDLRFVMGYSPLEYRDTLHMIADGRVNCTPLITATVGLDGVANAFAALADPEQHAKILIDPGRAPAQPA